MADLLLNLRFTLRPVDYIDIAIVAFIVYRVLVLIKGTRAMQMLTGLGILGLGFFLSSSFELYTTHWILSYFFDYLILIVIVLFQDDLRRALTHVGKNPFFSGASDEEEREVVDEIATAVFRMVKTRTGGLVVIERETSLKNFIDTGSQLDSKVKSEIMTSIFLPSSPIHDGALIVVGNRIAAAGCFLPLSQDSTLDKKFGTRHRAAIGVTEETDAIVVVVSEELGEVHLAKNGKMTMNLSEEELRQSLWALLEISKNQTLLPRRLQDWIKSVRKRSKVGK